MGARSNIPGIGLCNFRSDTERGTRYHLRKLSEREHAMTDIHDQAADELHAIVAQYSAGEAEVVTAYFPAATHG